MSHPQFCKFLINWKVYKCMTSLPIDQIASHLYRTCDEVVQDSLVNSHCDFLSMDENTMLKAIESSVTKSCNPAVHRMNFGNLNQHENEPIKDFLVRLRSMAIDCEFICPSCNHDLSSSNIKDQFLRGLLNETLQTDLLAKASQLKTIEDIRSARSPNVWIPTPETACQPSI